MQTTATVRKESQSVTEIDQAANDGHPSFEVLKSLQLLPSFASDNVPEQISRIAWVDGPTCRPADRMLGCGQERQDERGVGVGIVGERGGVCREGGERVLQQRATANKDSGSDEFVERQGGAGCHLNAHSASELQRNITAGLTVLMARGEEESGHTIRVRIQYAQRDPDA